MFKTGQEIKALVLPYYPTAFLNFYTRLLLAIYCCWLAAPPSEQAASAARKIMEEEKVKEKEVQESCGKAWQDFLQ